MTGRMMRSLLLPSLVAALALAFVERDRFAHACLGGVNHMAASGNAGLIQKSLAAAVLLTALALLPSLVRRWRGPSTIPPRDLHDRLSESYPPLVLDVRSAEEWAGDLGHIEGAVLMPLPELEAHIAELALHKRRLVVPV